MNLLPSKHHVVVWDPRDEYWEGSVVDQATARKIEQPPRCAVVLPTYVDMFRMSSVGGYSKRSWGAGIPLGGLMPRMNCPLTMFVHPEVRGLYWRARLVRDAADPRAAQAMDGMLRFAADGGQRAPTKAVYQEAGEPVSVKKLGPEHPEGGWIVGGQGLVMMQGDGHAGFGIYGVAPGLRCVWVAATMAEAR